MVFGSLRVLKRSYFSERKHWYWLCRCDCGNELEVRDTRLTGGNRRSCGCQASYRTHGMTGTRTHKTYETMMSRCYVETDSSYDSYGGRGITICERWHKFENFLADMGERPQDRTLDRIKNDEGYSKENCRWATLGTATQQA
jgi:hypothetical protein